MQMSGQERWKRSVGCMASVCEVNNGSWYADIATMNSLKSSYLFSLGSCMGFVRPMYIVNVRLRAKTSMI